MTSMIYKATAFSTDINGGNLAGVVLDADLLNEDQMLNIAQKIGYSETAFVMKSNKADFKLRFFTPVDEVDLCGHATVATFNLLRDLNIIDTGDYTQETKAGILKIKVQEKSIYMEQNTPQYFELLNKKELENCFQSSNKNYIDDMPIQIVSTGLKDIMLPVKNLETLIELKPNLDEIERLSKKYNAVGIHAFSLDTINDHEAHTRNFAPRYGINEESATGTSNGALACYLMNYLGNNFDGNFTIEQGYSMDRPSKIKVQLKYDGDNIKKVYVGGRAAIISSEELFF